MSVRSQIRRCVGTIACVSIPFLCGCAHQYEDAASPQWYLGGTQSPPNAAGALLLGNAAPSSGDVSDVTPVFYPGATGIRSSLNAPDERPSSSSFSCQRAAKPVGVSQPSFECGRWWL